jgi:hypothetical protein
MDKDEAVEQSKQEIVEHHRYLAQQDIDKIIETKDEFQIVQTVYLHAPIWLIKYEYKNKAYQLWVDGATGTAIKGDIPPAEFRII